MLGTFLFTGLTVGGIIIGLALMIRALDPGDDAVAPAVAMISGGLFAGAGILAVVVGLLALFVEAGGTMAAALMGVPVAVAVIAAAAIARQPAHADAVVASGAPSGTRNAARSAATLLVIIIAGLTVLAGIATLLCLLLDDPTATGFALVPVIAATISLPVSIAAGWIVLRTSAARSAWRRSRPAASSGAEPSWAAAQLGAPLLATVDAGVIIAVMLVPLGII